MSAILSYLTDFWNTVVSHWITHSIAVVVGWHLLPQPGYIGRLWGRIKKALGFVSTPTAPTPPAA